MLILYLEDNPNDSFLTQLQLKKTNPEFNIQVVHTVKEAFHVLEAGEISYDIVLTDLNLPDGNGLSLVNFIRSQKIPCAVVVVTGHSDEETAIAALKSGADDYISKNEGYLDRLPATLYSALERRRAETALQSHPLRVLYAENNVLDIDLTRRHLAKHATHIQIEFANNADQVYSHLADPNLSNKYDVLLLDYLLPGLNAIEVLKELRQEKKLDIPIILITGHGSEEIVLQAMKLGAADYVIKTPGYLYKLPAIIENVFHVNELAREQAALREAEERYRILVQQSPAASYIDAFDDDSSTLFISDQVESISGYTAQEWMEKPDFWLSLLHSDDRDIVIEEIKIHNETFAPFRMEYRLINRNGNVAWIRDEAILIFDEEDNPHHWQGILFDITDQKKSEETLHRRDNIMEAISNAAAKFLIAPWQENIQSILEELGQATKVSRSYIFRNHYLPGRILVTSMIYEWTGAGIQSFINDPDMVSFDFVNKGLKRWAKLMQERNPVYGNKFQFDLEENKFLEKHNIRSIVWIPIFVNHEWWGFIGLDDCYEERSWPSAEIEALRTAANTLGAAIQRLQAELALQRQLAEARVIQTITAAGTQATTLDELLEKITLIIDNFLEPDNCGTMLYDQSTEKFIYQFSYKEPENPQFHTMLLSSEQGITGRAFRTNQAQLVSDVKQDPDYIAATQDIKSELCVPLRTTERTIGVLNLESNTVNAFSQADLNLLITIADQLTTAIEKINLLENERRRLKESETLRQATAIVSTSLDLPTVLSAILSTVKHVVPYDSACIFMENEEDKILRIMAVQGFSNNNAIIGKDYTDKTLLFEQIRSSKEPLILHDAQSDSRFIIWEGAREDGKKIRGWLGVPLIARDEVVGFMTLDSHLSGAYDAENALILQTFAHQATEALINAQLYEMTRKRLREQEVINSVSSVLRASLNPIIILPNLLDQSLSALGCSSGAIWLYEGSTNEVAQVTASGWFSKLKNTRLKRNEGLSSFINFDKPYYIPSLVNDPRINPEDQKNIPQATGLLVVPIHTSTEPLGIIFVAFEASSKPGKDDINLISTLAEMTGNAAQRAELHQRTEKQVEQLTALRQIDIAINSALNLRYTLNVIIDQIIAQLNVDAACILIYNPSSSTLDYYEGRGFKTPDIEKAHLKLEETFANHQNKLTKDEIDHWATQQNNDIPLFLKKEGFQGYFSMPLIAKDEIKGMLEVYTCFSLTPDREWLKFFETIAGQTAIAIDNAELFSNLQLTNRELQQAYDTTLEGWGKALELRDQETEGHTKRVTQMTIKLARAMGMDGEDINHLKRGTQLHDIGKMGVPDEILHKPSSLTEDEWVIMRRHVDYAYELLSPIDYLDKAIEVPYCHHEKWDGSGYPRGLKGEEIPLSARIFAVIDVFDALSSDRPYRDAWDKKQVIAYIKEQTGSHFDPKVVVKFMELIESGEI
jgi:PAS domain S-box-containing protein